MKNVSHWFKQEVIHINNQGNSDKITKARERSMKTMEVIGLWAEKRQ